ncbi:MAG: hypothetical protein EHM20_00115 [Alphaproteobacteria bacterium]|nr:MAG: hypothetical protein EHM20_00115 [Alphaproteobacteria bacterium]
MKYSELRDIINNLSGLYNDKRVGPMIKMSLLKYMRELTKESQDLAIVINKIYLEYALKDEQGNVITHPFKMDYAIEHTFKDEEKTIILIPVTNHKEQYAIEMNFNDYQVAHSSACNFMENEFQPVNQFKLNIDDAIKYNLSAKEIDYLETVNIIYDSDNKKIIMPKIIK